MQPQSYLVLLDRFTCIADRCPDNCCHGWDIPIDKATYQHWQTLDDGDIKQGLLASIKTASVDENTCHKVVQDEKKACTHLSQTGLCYVQQQLGHTALPQTCREYPRVQVGSENFLTDSASLSCPEMVRLAVTAKNAKALFVDSALPPAADNGLAKVMGALDKLCRTLLPVHIAPAGITLLYLTSVVAELMQTEPGQPLLLLLKKTANTSNKTLSKRLKSLQQASQAGRLPKDEEDEKLFWSFVLRLTNNAKLQDLKTLLEKNGFSGMYAGQNETAHQAAYLKLKAFIGSQQHSPARHKWQPALRNYLIVKLRNHGFPHAPVQGNFLVNLLDCSVALASIQLWMWLLLKEKKTITESELVTIIYKVERALIHNDSFYEQLNKSPQLLDRPTYLGCLADLG